MAMPEKKGGLMSALGLEDSGPKSDSMASGGTHDVDARMFKKALDAGDGERAYSILKGWIHECLDESESEEDPDEEVTGAGSGY